MTDRLTEIEERYQNSIVVEPGMWFAPEDIEWLIEEVKRLTCESRAADNFCSRALVAEAEVRRLRKPETVLVDVWNRCVLALTEVAQNEV